MIIDLGSELTSKLTVAYVSIFAVVILTSYMIGNISPAIILGKIYKTDIRKVGSGNAGTTNVLRTLGKRAASITLLIDVFKGVIPVLLIRYGFSWYLGDAFAENLSIWAGFFVICGHVWPIIFGFKGGKGVATTFGVLMATVPVLGLAELGIMVFTVGITRMVSLGSVIGALAFPLMVSKFYPIYLPWALCLALLVLYKHNENIGRIVRGEESKINFKK